MHALRRADDRIHRASLDAQRAADASRLVDESDGARLVLAAGGIECLRLDTQKAREGIGFEAKVGLAEGLRRLVTWWRSVKNESST